MRVFVFYHSFQVQQKAAEAKETADRARQQIKDSMKKLKDLKNRLQEVGTNDVKGKDEKLFLLCRII